MQSPVRYLVCRCITWAINQKFWVDSFRSVSLNTVADLGFFEGGGPIFFFVFSLNSNFSFRVLTSCSGVIRVEKEGSQLEKRDNDRVIAL